MMRRLVRVARDGDWPSDQAVDAVTLSFDDRHRRRIRLTTDDGESILLDLQKPLPMAAGDGLETEDGEWMAIKAAAEDVLEIQAADEAHLARLAWHLGNRHQPLQVTPEGRLRIRYDHVIADMMSRLGATTARAEAPFQPEGGAYGNHGR